MRAWKMPESIRLEAQTLEKLSIAPWRFLRNETDESSAKLLQPLFEDMVEEETYIQVVKRDTNSQAETVIAVHLNDPRAALWQTSLTTVLESLTGTHPANTQPPGSISRWSLSNSPAPNVIEFTRVGGWTLIGLAQDHNALLPEAIDRVRHDQPPMDAPAGNAWLDVRADLSRFTGGLGDNLRFSSNSPTISLSIKGENQNVRTYGQLSFPNQVARTLPPWNAPTNLISTELASFTAIRGVKEVLGASPLWKELQAGEAPDQVFVWAAPDSPSRTYFALPRADASNVVAKIGDLALNTNSSWFTATHLVGSLKPGKPGGLQWVGLPLMSPFLESTNIDGNAFVMGGFFQQESSQIGPPPTLLPQLNQTNLVAYDWEMTGPRIQHLIYLGQLTRVAMGKAQLPANSLSLAWLTAASHWGAFSATEITQTAPGQFTFNRKSSIGFTAIELHLLADWLESPDFPLGLHTSRAQSAPASP